MVGETVGVGQAIEDALLVDVGHALLDSVVDGDSVVSVMLASTGLAALLVGVGHALLVSVVDEESVTFSLTGLVGPIE